MINLFPNIIFDLDGTLVDSAPSLCKAGNFLLDGLDRPRIDIETYKTFIGKGLLKQVEQLLVHTGGVPDNNLDKQFKLFRQFYNSNPLVSTVVYDGVFDALEALKATRAKLAICTQKLEEPARIILKELKLEHYFDGFAFGDSLSVMKPHPDMVFHSITGFGDGPLIYIGDSETDAATAQNVDAFFLLFSGGYRKTSVEAIKNHGFFNHHCEIPDLIKKILGDGP